MAGVQLYKSTDASAPVLTGQVGSLVALLDACLVTGYGAKVAAGWTKPFTGINAAAFRNSATLGTGFYINVNDNAPGAGGATEARLRGYETMSAVDTGTGPFPSVGQKIDGLFCRKSATANATARPWFVVADETVFYLFVETGDFTAPAVCMTFAFGDYFSFKTNDTYRCVIIGRDSENNNTRVNDTLSRILSIGVALNSVLAGHYTARNWTGIGGSLQVGKHIDTSKLGNYTTNSDCIGSYSSTVLVYPNGPDAGLYLSPIWLNHDMSIRGYLKGLWAPLQNRPLSHGDTFSGTGVMSSKNFLTLNIGGSSFFEANGEIMVETTNTWS